MKKLLVLFAVSLGMIGFSMENYDVKVLGNATYNYNGSYNLGAEANILTKDNYFSQDMYFKGGVGLNGGFNLKNGLRSGYLGPTVSGIVGKDVYRDVQVYGGVQAGLPIEGQIKEKKLILSVDPTITVFAGAKYPILTAEVGFGYPGIVSGKVGISF